MLQGNRKGEKAQVSEPGGSTLYCSTQSELGRAVEIFPSECLKDGGVFVALSSQVPQMAQCTSNGKPFIWPWDCTCCTSRWFMEETSSDSLSRRRGACGWEGIMEERHKRAGAWVRGSGRGEEGCYFSVIPQDPLLLGLAVRKKKKKNQFNLKVVQGKWTRELSGWNLIRDPPNYCYLPSRKVKWLQRPEELREVGRISSPEGEVLHTFQVLSRKLLKVNFFFLNVNALGTEDCKAENTAMERADVGPTEIWKASSVSIPPGERQDPWYSHLHPQDRVP